MRADSLPEVTIQLPHRLRPLAGDQRDVHVRASRVGEALDRLTELYPELRSRLREGGGRLRPSVLFFLNAEDVRSRQGEGTALSEGDTITIVPVADGG
jgi:molybdopterin synthase sulfur carrier subunit